MNAKNNQVDVVFDKEISDLFSPLRELLEDDKQKGVPTGVIYGTLDGNTFKAKYIEYETVLKINNATSNKYSKLYAKIVETSKYYDGQKTNRPFRVSLNNRGDDYIWYGNRNDYRTEDLEFFMEETDGYLRQFKMVDRESIPELEMCLDSMLKFMKGILNGSNISENIFLYNDHREASWLKKLTEIAELMPNHKPRCSQCARYCSYGCEREEMGY